MAEWADAARARRLARMPSLPRRTFAAVLAVSALGLSACGGDGESTEVLRQNLEAQDAALQALQGRVSDLASEVRATSTPVTEDEPEDTGPQVEEVATRLDELVTRLEEVESTVAEQAGEDVTATVAAELGKFREEIEGLVASVRDLTTVVNQVRTDVDELETTLEEHGDDPFAHDRGEPDAE